jgi:hypothetical protein
MSERKIVEYKGESHSLYEWATILNRNYSSLRDRYDKGLRGEELFVDKITVKCKICGKEFVTNKTIKQCCSAECVKINAKNNYQAISERRKEERQKKKEKKVTLTEMAIKAKQLGMSYGQYSAMMYMQKH